jgi:hypothetical protein
VVIGHIMEGIYDGTKPDSPCQQGREKEEGARVPQPPSKAPPPMM